MLGAGGGVVLDVLLLEVGRRQGGHCDVELCVCMSFAPSACSCKLFAGGVLRLFV